MPPIIWAAWIAYPASPRKWKRLTDRSEAKISMPPWRQS